MQVDGWRRVRAALALVIAALLASGCAGLPRDVQRTPSVALAASADTELGRIALASTKDPALSGFRLMSWSEQSFATRLALAARAERSLDVQYYVFDDDGTGRALMRAARCRRGRGRSLRAARRPLHRRIRCCSAWSRIRCQVRLFNPAMVRYESAPRNGFPLFDFGRVNHRMLTSRSSPTADGGGGRGTSGTSISWPTRGPTTSTSMCSRSARCCRRWRACSTSTGTASTSIRSRRSCRRAGRPRRAVAASRRRRWRRAGRRCRRQGPRTCSASSGSPTSSAPDGSN